jgi:tetratricopeptide (TPR) repeat protein
MKFSTFLFCLLCICFSSTVLHAQKPAHKADPKEASDKFTNNNFDGALDDYLQLLGEDPKNDKYNYRVGVCYLNTNINRKKAVPYFEFVTSQPKYDPDAMYLLGRSYAFAYRFDDALKCYNKFKAGGRGTSDNLRDVDREIQNCYNAKELMKFPLDVTFENLGKNINTQYADYWPFVPSDESFLIFNSKRPDGGAVMEMDGEYASGIFMSRVVNGVFSKAKNIGPPINTSEGDEEVIGLSASGEEMLVYYDNMQGVGDIYLAEADKKGNFKKADILDPAINSPNGFEISAAITNDGQTIYFTSDRKGGLGGTDIWVSHRLPTGHWGEATNMGPEVNTEMDEDFPSISPDGKTLYFSSKGHTTMGGYDIFKLEWDELHHKWANLKNLGYPINTVEDNMNFRISETGRFGYISAIRDDGLGDLDIYRVTFNNVEPKYSILKGRVLSADTAKKVNYADVFITVLSEKIQDNIGNYVPNSNTGKYVIIVPPGSYSVNIELPGFQSYTQKVNIVDKSSFKTEIERDIVLIPVGYVPPAAPGAAKGATGSKPSGSATPPKKAK